MKQMMNRAKHARKHTAAEIAKLNVRTCSCGARMREADMQCRACVAEREREVLKAESD